VTHEAADTGDRFIRYGTLAAFALVLLGLVLRLRGLGEYWINPDEGIYYSTLTRSSFSTFWAEVTANAHPPLFYLLLRGAGAITWDFVWLRGVSVVFGTAAIWAFWLVGRELGGRGRGGVVAGLVSAALVAVSAEAITLSQIIRPYMMISALLAGALFNLLRYRSDPSTRRLALYTACIVAAVLIHYSAVLAFASCCAVVAYYRLAGEVRGVAWRRLGLAQLVPAATFAGLYAWHLGRTMGSDLVGDALGPNGWLSEWLVTSPRDAWYAFSAFQAYHLPPDFRGRAALLLLAALGVALVRDRLAAVVAGVPLSGAVAASALGLYPFGPTRHDAWLVVFTLPVIGWLIGHVVELGPRPARIAAVVLVLALLGGGPVERVFGADLLRSNATEEQVVKRRDLAPLVLGELDPAEGAPTILMTEQSYNLLVPLYADRREDVRTAPDSSALAFSYGARTIVVARRWDWDDVEQLDGTLASALAIPGVAPGTAGPLAVVAGGWGTALFPTGVERLRERGAILNAVPVLGEDPTGAPILRVIGLELDRAVMEAGP
jgi:hypothetical protein